MQSVCRKSLLLLLLGSGLRAADAPYFVTYSHRMEEPGNLEIAFEGTTASPAGGNAFLNSLLEIEYGVTAWRTRASPTQFPGSRGNARSKPS